MQAMRIRRLKRKGIRSGKNKLKKFIVNTLHMGQFIMLNGKFVVT
jgi:hypothetical protein